MPGEISKENGRKGGRPPKTKNKKTLEREAVLEAMKQRTMKIAERIMDSQLVLARGQTFLYKIEKEKIIGPKGGVSYRSKKPVRVTDEWEIASFLEGMVGKANGDIDDHNNPGDTYYFLTTKEPDNSAIDSLFDRTFGKSQRSVEVKGSLSISKILDEVEND